MAHLTPYNDSSKVLMGNATSTPISVIGASYFFSTHKHMLISQLILVPGVTKKLLFVSQFTEENNVCFEFYLSHCLFKDLSTDQILLRDTEENGLYTLGLHQHH